MVIDDVAFRDFTLWLLSQPAGRKAFEEATGRVIPRSPASPIESMIDVATGAAETWVQPFVEWAAGQWSPEMLERVVSARTRSPSEGSL